MKLSSTVLSLVIAAGMYVHAEGTMSIRGNSKAAGKLMTFARRLSEDEDSDESGSEEESESESESEDESESQSESEEEEEKEEEEQNAQGSGYNNNYNNNNQQQVANGYGDGYNNNYNYGNNQQMNNYGGQYGEMNEESMYFLNNYAISLQSCISGEQVINYENGEMEPSTVVFRLCPIDDCDCTSGYGDYAVGINTFLEAYKEEMKDQQNGQNGQNGQYNSMVVYNQYGQEFNAEEFMECREYNIEQEGGEGEEGQEDQNQQQQNYNGQYQNNNGQYYQNMQFFIGPGCSDDGKSIVLGMYNDQYCTYPSNMNFGDVAYGWDSLPFSDGSLVSLQCKPCYGMNENYEYEQSRTCMELYQESTSRCEQNMEYYSYYGQNVQGCDYLDQLTASSSGYADGSSSSSGDKTITFDYGEIEQKFMDTLSTREARVFIAGLTLLLIAICVLTISITRCCIKARRDLKRSKARQDATEGKGNNLIGADTDDDSM